MTAAVVGYRRMVGESCSSVWQTPFQQERGDSLHSRRFETNDAACLGVEMIGPARSEIVRSTAETGTIRPNILE